MSSSNSLCCVTLIPVLFLIGCQSDEHILDFKVESSQSVDISIYSDQLDAINVNPEKDHTTYDFISMFWFYSGAKDSSASISHSTTDQYRLYEITSISDQVPGDDSVAGYRFDVKLKELSSNGHWEIISVNKSWRCWEGRGHRDFSNEPCI